jgi:hypothetical protein
LYIELLAWIVNLPVPGAQHDFGIECEHHRGQFRGGIRVRQISPDRAAIADRSMSNMSVCRNDQWCVLPHGRGRQHVRMPRQSANHKPVTIDPDPIEPPGPD